MNNNIGINQFIVIMFIIIKMAHLLAFQVPNVAYQELL